MKKRGRPMVYNEVEILKEIHRLKALTVNQIAQLYFNGKIENAYKQIKKMEEKHYIDSTIHFVQGRRQNKVLHLTKLGSERLVSEGVKGIRVKTTTELKPDRSLLHYIVSVNDVFVRLMKAGISVIDSREWKVQHGMNRTARARGGVKLKNGDEYGYYMFIENAYKRKRTPLLHDKTIEIMMNEIEMYKQSGKIICLVPTKDIYEQLMEHKSEKRSFLLFMSSHLGEFCLIPMGKDFAVDIITLPNGENDRIEQFQSVLGGKVKKSSEVEDSNKSLFASYVHEKDGEEAYVVDHLLMNWNAILMLRKIYTPQKFNQDGKRVKVICWLPAEKSIEKILKGYDHVDLVMVGKEELERWKSVPEEKIKDAISL